MGIIAKLTLRHLIQNKKRTIVTILGIATSTALIGAILLGVFSFFRFFGYLAIQTEGNTHAVFYELTEEQMRAVKTDERVLLAGLSDENPKVSGVRLGVEVDDKNRIGNIRHGDETFYEEMVVSDYEGTLPSNASEIAVEAQFLADNNLNLSVGDSLTFEEGYRYIYEGEELVYLAGNYRSDESFSTNETVTCKITAILHDNRPTSGYDILRGMDPGYFPEQKDMSLRIALAKCNTTALRQLNDIVADYGIGKYAYNTEYLLSVFAFEDASGSYKAFFVIMGIALVIVIATSVILIVNSIGMSLAERMRYLGMLASVGATGSQKRFSIYFEGFVLGLIGIPLGILMGYLGTKVTLNYLGTRIMEAEILLGSEGMQGSIPVRCSPWVILAIVIFAAVTIYLSVLVPAFRAARIMPVDALRQTNTIKSSARHLRVHPLIRKIFGCEGELAYKNIKRNGIKGTVITLSIAVSVVMFLSINFFCDSIKRANMFELDLPFQLVVSCDLDESDKLRESLSRMEGVERVYNGGMIQFSFKEDPEGKTVPANGDIANPVFLTKDYADLDVDSMAVVMIDDADFETLLAANNLPKEKYFDGKLRGVLLNNYFHEKKGSPVFNEGILGQSLYYDEVTGNPPAIEIWDFVTYDPDNYIFKLTPRGTITVYVPASVYYEKAKETLQGMNLTRDLCIETSDANAMEERLYAMLEEDGYHNYFVSNMTETVAIMNTVTMLLKTAMYGFTVLLTLITVTNIVNTISTGMLLRRREFAMYKSMGMTIHGFQKMIRLETILYGLRALIIGIPVALLLSFLMYSAFDREIYTFDPNPLMYLAVILAVFAVVGLSMFLAVGKMKDDNIIEALKYEMV